MIPEGSSSRTYRLRYAGIALTIFVAAVFVNSGTARAFFSHWVPTQRVYLVVYAIQIILCLAGLFWAHRIGLPAALRELGLRGRAGIPLLFALVATAPMLIGFAWAGELRSEVHVPFLLMTAVFAPVVEEVIYRGYVFRQLYRRARWGFWPAALLPAVFFGFGHLY